MFLEHQIYYNRKLKIAGKYGDNINHFMHEFCFDLIVFFLCYVYIALRVGKTRFEF